MKKFSLNEENKIDELNELLEGFGVQIDLQAQNVYVDEERLKQMRKRNAGRHYAILRENGFLAHITKGQVRERMKSEKAEEIARKLGISRRTLFRRLKEARSDEDELL